MRRYLMWGEESDGYLTEEYILIQVAKYLNTTVWDLLEKPAFWVTKALNYMTAEAQAQKALEKSLLEKQRKGGWKG